MISTQEISFIQADLQKRGLTYEVLQSEIIDHICCAIEEKIEEGISFHKAYEEVVVDFGEDAFPELQSQTMRAARSTSPWKRWMVWLSSVAACLSFFVVFARDGQAQNFPGIAPLQEAYEVSRDFGSYTHPVYEMEEFHSGLDLATEKPSEVYATANGVVEQVSQELDNGSYRVIIRHPKALKTLYLGLEEIYVEEGQEIQQKDPIGNIADKAKNTLHYEIIWEGEPVDPEPYFPR